MARNKDSLTISSNSPTRAEVSVRIGLRRQINVMHAVILRDIRSRYFNHGLGFLIVPLLPLAHIALLLGIYKAIGKPAQFGDDLTLFFATGLIPALTFSYLSRYMSTSVLSNKNMLSFPAVQLLDIILARCALEFIGIVIAVFLVVVLLLSAGSDPSPVDVGAAISAFFFSVCLGLGVGIIVSTITAIFPFFAILYSLFCVLIYLSSGGPIYLHVFPEQVVYFATYNPVFQAVEWMRSAYYVGYPTQDLDKTYLIQWSISSLAVGLVMERYLKQQILNG